jgi:hypothetical protein
MASNLDVNTSNSSLKDKGTSSQTKGLVRPVAKPEEYLPTTLLNNNHSHTRNNIAPSVTTSRIDKTSLNETSSSEVVLRERLPDNLLDKIETNARSSDSFINLHHENSNHVGTEGDSNGDNIANPDLNTDTNSKIGYNVNTINTHDTIRKVQPTDIHLNVVESRNHLHYSNANEVNIYNVYRHNANTIPPYVIDRLSHFPNQGDKGPFVDITHHLGDPFKDTFIDEKDNVRWGEFLSTVKAARSGFPVKTSMNIIDHGYETGKTPDRYVNVDGEIRAYAPDGKVVDEETCNRKKRTVADEIYRSYDLNSQWKGGNRLKGLFESPDIYSDQTDDEDDACSMFSGSDDNAGGNGADVDLEKGGYGSGKGRRRRKLKQFNIYRRNRERDIRERAKYWIEENKKDWKPKLFESIRTNSHFPLFFRVISLALSSVVLGLSARIVRVTERFDISQQPSPLMAVIVQSVSILYLFYITYDEFTSQPLGLRNPRAKIRLIMLDLIFIIFSSANLALSFQSLFDNRWVCKISEGVATKDADALFDSNLCDKVKALTAFLFLTLAVWCINFSISVFRVVHLVSYREN